FDGVDVGRRDDLVDLVPIGTHEAAQAAHGLVAGGLFRVGHDGLPGLDGAHRLALLAPQPGQAATQHRVLDAVGAVQVPRERGPPRTAARLVIGHVGTGARIVGLLRFPGDQAALDVDFPGTRPGAVHAVRGTHDLVVLPAVAVGVFPGAVFADHGAVPIGKGFLGTGKILQAVDEMAHGR